MPEGDKRSPQVGESQPSGSPPKEQGSQATFQSDPNQFQTPYPATTAYQQGKEKNPCFCCQLQHGVLCAAIYGIVAYFLSMISSGSSLAGGFTPVHGSSSTAANAFGILQSTVGLAFAIVLTIGVVQKSVTMVKVGFGGCIGAYVLCLIFMVIYVVALILYLHIYKEEHKDQDKESVESVSRIIIVVICLLCVAILIYSAVYIYVLYVIYVYAKQLTRTGQPLTPMGAPAYGQFPAGPPPPYYQPSAPNTDYSQTKVQSNGQQ